MNILLECAQATFRFGHRGEINNAEKPFYLGKNLADLGHEVTVVYQNPFGMGKMLSSKYKGLRIFFLPDLTPSPIYGPYKNLFERGVRRAIETTSRVMLQPMIQLRERYDIVHSFWPGWLENFIPIWTARHLTRAHTVIDFEDRIGGREGYVNLSKDSHVVKWLKRSWFGLLENRSAKLAEAAIASTDLMKLLLRSLGIQDDKIFRIPRGVDTVLYKPLKRNLARRRVGLGPNCKIVGYLGGSLRLPEYHEILLRTFSRILRAWPDSKLLLIGRRIPASARTMIASLELQKAVILTNTLQLEEIPTYLSAADVLVLPLLNNFVDRCRWPNRLLEYMACGRAVVVSSVGEAPRMVTKHKCGLVAQSGRHTDLADRLDYLLGHPEEAEELGIRARSAVEHNYTWLSVAKSTERVYHAINN